MDDDVLTTKELEALDDILSIKDDTIKKTALRREPDSTFAKLKIQASKSLGLPIASPESGAIASFFQAPYTQTDEQGRIYQTSNHELNDNSQYQALQELQKGIHQNRDEDGRHIYAWLDFDEEGNELMKVGTADEDIVTSYGRRLLKQKGIKNPKNIDRIKEAGKAFFAEKKILFDEKVSNADELERRFHGALGNRNRAVINFGRKTKNDFSGATEQVTLENKINPKDYQIDNYMEKIKTIVDNETYQEVAQKVFRRRQNWETRKEYVEARENFEEKQEQLLNDYRFTKIKDTPIHDLKTIDDIQLSVSKKDGDGLKSFSPVGGAELDDLMANNVFRKKTGEIIKAIEGVDISKMNFSQAKAVAKDFFSQQANNLTVMGGTAIGAIGNMAKKQKSDYLKLMDIYSHTDLTAQQVVRGIENTITDPTTYLSAGLGNLAKKVLGKTVVKEMVTKELAKGATKEQIAKKVRKEILFNNTLNAAVDGALGGAIKASSEEKLMSDSLGRKISYENILKSTVAGGVIGAVIGRSMSKLTGKNNSEQITKHINSLSDKEKMELVEELRPEQKTDIIDQLEKQGAITKEQILKSGDNSTTIGRNKSEDITPVKTSKQTKSKNEQEATSTLASLPTEIKDIHNIDRESKPISLPIKFAGDARRNYEIDHPLSPKGGLAQAATIKDGKIPVTEKEVLESFDRIEESMKTKKTEQNYKMETSTRKKKDILDTKEDIVNKAMSLARKNNQEEELPKLEVLLNDIVQEKEELKGLELPEYKKKEARLEFANDEANKIQDPSIDWQLKHEKEQNIREEYRKEKGKYSKDGTVQHLQPIENVRQIIERNLKESENDAKLANLDIIEATNNKWNRVNLGKNAKGTDQYSTMKLQHYWERKHDLKQNLSEEQLQYREYRRVREERKLLENLDVSKPEDLRRLELYRNKLTELGEKPEEIKISEKKSKLPPTQEMLDKRTKQFLIDTENKQKGMLRNIERVRKEIHKGQTRKGVFNKKNTGDKVFTDTTRKLIKSGFFTDKEIQEAYIPSARTFEEQELLKNKRKQELIAKYNKKRADQLGVRIDTKASEYNPVNVQMNITDTSNSMGQTAAAVLGDSKLAIGTNLFDNKAKQDMRISKSENVNASIEDLMRKDGVIEGMTFTKDDIKKLYTPQIYEQGDKSAIKGIMSRHNVNEAKATEIYKSFDKALQQVAPKLYEFKKNIQATVKLGRVPKKVNFKVLGENIRFNSVDPENVKIYINGELLEGKRTVDKVNTDKRGLLAAFLQAHDAIVAKRWAKEGIRAIHDAPLEEQVGKASQIHKQSMLEAWKGDDVNNFLKAIGYTGKRIEKDTLPNDDIILKSKHSMEVEHSKGLNKIENPRHVYDGKILSDREIILESIIRKNPFKLDYKQYLDRVAEQSRSLAPMTEEQLKKADRVEQAFELARLNSKFDITKFPNYAENGTDFTPIKIASYKKAFYDSRARLEASTTTREKLQGDLIFFDKRGLPFSPDRNVAKQTLTELIDKKEREYLEQMNSLPKATRELLKATGEDWDKLFAKQQAKRLNLRKNKLTLNKGKRC